MVSGLVEKARETIARHRMIGRGQSVAVGVSGGADSVALLYFLCGIRDEWDLTLSAYHVNHMLRGAESDRDERYVRELCGDLNVPLEVMRADVAAEAKCAARTVEEQAREIRYRFFESAGTDRIATAHTLDDSLETALINLARGTGLRGLCGIPPVRGRIIRPLIDCTRTETESYCAQMGARFVTDSSNLTDKYARNRIRRQAVPALRSVAGDPEAAFRRSAVLLREEDAFLDRLAAELLAAARTESGYSAEILCSAELALRRRAAARLLAESGAGVSFRRVETVLGLLESGRTEFTREQISDDLFGTVRGGLLTLERNLPSAPYFSIPFEEGEIRLNDKFSVKCSVVNRDVHNYFKKVHANVLQSCFDYDRINGIVSLRQRLAGDRISLPGRGGSKTLKKLLNEAAVPGWMRSRIPCAADAEGVFWVYGFGCAQRAAVDETSVRIGVIEVCETGEESENED